jgi:hypothetical protein
MASEELFPSVWIGRRDADFYLMGLAQKAPQVIARSS